MSDCPIYLPWQIPPDLDTGDVLFTHGPDWKSRVVRWWTRHRGEAKSVADHQQIIYSPLKTLSYTLANGPTWFTIPEYWAGMKRRNDEWIIFRRVTPPTERQKAVCMDKMERSWLTWKYSKPELGLQGLDNLLEKIAGRRIIFFRKLGRLWKDGVVCSTGSNIILKALGWLPPSSRYFSPDDTIDFMLAHPDQWRPIARSIAWTQFTGKG